MTQTFLASLARIADFETNPYDVRALRHEDWASGDYVQAEVAGPASELYVVESCSGAMLPVRPGDEIVGALGERAATLEGVGSYKDVRNGRMHALTAAGLFGWFTSFACTLPSPMSLVYRGHIVRDGNKVTMRQFAIRAKPSKFSIPTILLVGTSMSAGKTVTGRRVCKLLSSAGYRVVGAKLTGAGRYRDIASFKRAGANTIFDFVDVGLPSTVVPPDEFRQAIRPLLSRINDLKPDFLVAEAGASPLEPYNGDAAIDELGDTICCTILCASDPYAVVGVRQAFGITPDLVAGPAANTSAAVDLVRKLAGLPALNVIDRGTLPALRDFLERTLQLNLGEPASRLC
ncbi:MAG: hypothetical protein OER22_03785 [Gammaproteobacteria bacterium]|nr:hypothetical protein [Gammaproteobacteria bacterium]MDH3372705.1 hypothetical protein [Gammaproteobacteria bacterium]MDH3409736.1 hypothetical protein [Gammaproteobacteria bacterium]MDH3551716.1 hypothetical protein [Gammaproteobacteria bacterium]